MKRIGYISLAILGLLSGEQLKWLHHPFLLRVPRVGKSWITLWYGVGQRHFRLTRPACAQCANIPPEHEGKVEGEGNGTGLVCGLCMLDMNVNWALAFSTRKLLRKPCVVGVHVHDEYDDDEGPIPLHCRSLRHSATPTFHCHHLIYILKVLLGHSMPTGSCL